MSVKQHSFKSALDLVLAFYPGKINKIYKIYLIDI